MACSRLLFMRKSATCFTHVEKSSLLDHLYIMKSFICSALLSALFTSLVISSAVAGFEEGIAAYQANNLPLAYKEFRAAAENGHIDSQFNLGLMYEKGKGINKDEKEAIVWYRKSAEQGNAFAQYNLAVLYENGRGTAVDFAQANEWYRKASVQGDPLAIGNLGMLYVRGQGVKENTVAGVALLLLSATMDSSPGNYAKQNIAGIRGLTPGMIDAAKTLFTELGNAENLLVPFDQYLKKTETN
jgi:TPR repeat protein